MSRNNKTAFAAAAFMTIMTLHTAKSQQASNDPDLEAAKRAFGTMQQQPAPTPVPSTPDQIPAAGSLSPDIDATLQDEPALDAEAGAALARQNLDKIDHEAAKALAGFDRNALTQRLQQSETAVDEWLKNATAQHSEPPRPVK